MRAAAAAGSRKAKVSPELTFQSRPPGPSAARRMAWASRRRCVRSIRTRPPPIIGTRPRAIAARPGQERVTVRPVDGARPDRCAGHGGAVGGRHHLLRAALGVHVWGRGAGGEGGVLGDVQSVGAVGVKVRGGGEYEVGRVRGARGEQQAAGRGDVGRLEGCGRPRRSRARRSGTRRPFRRGGARARPWSGLTGGGGAHGEIVSGSGDMKRLGFRTPFNRIDDDRLLRELS